MKGLILTYAITALGSIGALRYPQVGLYVYVGFAVLRPQAIFGWAGDLSRISFIVGTAMLIGWIFRGFGSWRLGRARPPVFALLGFAAWFVLSAFQAIDPRAALVSIEHFARTLLPFFVGVTCLRDREDWRRLLWTIVLCQGYVAFEMHVDYLLRSYNTASEGFGGMDNNFFGLALVTTLGPAIGLAIGARTWWSRTAAATAAVLILHTTLLTFSRGAMVGLLAVGFTAFVMMPKRPRYLLAVALTMALTIRLVGPELAERYRTAFAPVEAQDASAESRIDLWRDCIRVMEAYPVFGVGPANWVVIAEQYGWPPGKSAHSVWMETAAETGFPGALLLLMFFVTSIGGLWSIARAKRAGASPQQVAAANGVVLGLVGFAVAGQFVSAPNLELAYYLNLAGILLWRSAGAAVAEASAEVPRPAAAGPALHAAPHAVSGWSGVREARRSLPRP